MKILLLILSVLLFNILVNKSNWNDYLGNKVIHSLVFYVFFFFVDLTFGIIEQFIYLEYSGNCSKINATNFGIK